jgi:hypothetical protein
MDIRQRDFLFNITNSLEKQGESRRLFRDDALFFHILPAPILGSGDKGVGIDNKQIFRKNFLGLHPDLIKLDQSANIYIKCLTV